MEVISNSVLLFVREMVVAVRPPEETGLRDAEMTDLERER